MNKSSLSCKWSIQLLLEGKKTAYLWTFTFRECLPIPEACSRWMILQHELVRIIGFRGVRVYELHPGGHGLHIHAVTADRHNVNAVRHFSNSFGFGRIHVKAIPAESADYIAKYLTKARRSPELKGRRLWACMGFKGAKIKDCELDTPLTRAIKKISNEDIRKHFERRNWVVPTSPRTINFVKFIMANAALLSIEHRIGFTDYPACALDKVAGEDAAFIDRELLVMGHWKSEALRFEGYLAKVAGAGPDWERLAIIHENSKADGILGRDEILVVFEKLSPTEGNAPDTFARDGGVL